MKRALIGFAALTTLLFLFNILSYIVGMLFVDDFGSYVYSQIQVIDELVTIVLFVPFLLLAIRFYRKGGIFIFSIINIILGILVLRNDSMDTGWEFISSFVFLVSKFNHLLAVLFDFEGWQKINVTVIWGCYIVLVGYSYVFIRKKIDAISPRKKRQPDSTRK